MSKQRPWKETDLVSVWLKNKLNKSVIKIAKKWKKKGFLTFFWSLALQVPILTNTLLDIYNILIWLGPLVKRYLDIINAFLLH